MVHNGLLLGSYRKVRSPLASLPFPTSGLTPFAKGHRNVYWSVKTKTENRNKEALRKEKGGINARGNETEINESINGRM